MHDREASALTCFASLKEACIALAACSRRRALLLGLALNLLWATVGSSQISKQELLEMVAKGLPTDVIVALVQRKCVSFPVDANSLVELKDLPQPLLAAIVTCQDNKPAVPQGSGPAKNQDDALVTVDIKKFGQDKDEEKWGYFITLSTEKHVDADMGIAFTWDAAGPEEVLRPINTGGSLRGDFLGGSQKDRVSFTFFCLPIPPCWVTFYGIYWSPARMSVELRMPPGTHKLQAYVLARVPGRDWESTKFYGTAGGKCESGATEAVYPLTLAEGERRRVTFVTESKKVKWKRGAGVCNTLRFE
jgi:hypothetical protein